MRTLVVVSRLADWPLELEGIEVVAAADYLADSAWTKQRGVRVFNLCRSFRYQSKGYYVSLLAAARRHRPFPDLMTLLDMRSRALVRSSDEDLDRIIQKSLADLRSSPFELSVYFGRNVAERHGRLARALFAQFPAPLLRAHFHRGERWRLTSVTPLALHDVPDTHWDTLRDSAAEYFSRPRYRARASKPARYDLAILHDPHEALAPSDPRALDRFQAEAQRLQLGVERITRDDYGRLGEFDALLIRETTRVDHHTFRFSQRAEAEGLAVLDDPQSILRCTNKVFQAETFEIRGVPAPRTLVTERVDAKEIARLIGFPCVLKVPDSAFSQGVLKCADAAEVEREGARILEKSDLLLVQEFTPSQFDWRIGVLGGEPLYACRYHMAQGHWQIVRHTGAGRFRYGRVEPVPLADAPARVVRVALQAARAIGNGLYGVDVKQVGRRTLVMEVNDNPNIDAGCEDFELKGELYARILRHLIERVEARRGGAR